LPPLSPSELAIPAELAALAELGKLGMMSGRPLRELVAWSPPSASELLLFMTVGAGVGLGVCLGVGEAVDLGLGLGLGLVGGLVTRCPRVCRPASSDRR